MKNLIKVMLVIVLTVFAIGFLNVKADELEQDMNENKQTDVTPEKEETTEVVASESNRKEEVETESASDKKEETVIEEKTETVSETVEEEKTTEEEKTIEEEMVEPVLSETLNVPSTPEEATEQDEKEEETVQEPVKSKKAPTRGSSDVINVTINIYVNNKFKGSDHTDSEEFMELEYGSLPFGYMYGDIYGEYQSGSATVNGQTATYFCFDGENASIFGPGFSNLVPGDEVVVNLYYKNEEEEEEVVYGTISLNISDGKKPVSGYEITINGKKGIDTDSKTITSDENGDAIGNEFDISYTWTYEIEGSTYVVSFDEDNTWHSDHTIKVEEPIIETNVTGKINIYGDNKLLGTEDLFTHGNKEETLKEGKIYGYGNRPNQYRFVKAVLTLNGTEVKNGIIPDDTKTWATFEPFETLDGELIVDLYYEYTEEERNKEYTITVKHQFVPEKGGTIVDGYDEGAIVIDGVSYKAKGGESINPSDIWKAVDGEFELAEGNSFKSRDLVKLGNDYYEILGCFATGGDNNILLGSVTGTRYNVDVPFDMIHHDITIIYNYYYVYPVYIVNVKYIDDDTKEEITKGVSYKYPNNTPNEDNTLTWEEDVKKAFKGTSDLNGKQYYDMTMFAEDGRWFREYPNYEFVRVEGDPFTGESTSDKVIYMYYSHLKSVVRVHHVDEDGNYIKTDENGKDVEFYQELPGKVGDKFEVSAIEIEGYINTIDGEYVHDENIVEGEYTLEDQDIYFFYTKLPVGDDGEDVIPDENEEDEELPPQTGVEGFIFEFISLIAIFVLLIIKK